MEEKILVSIVVVLSIMAGFITTVLVLTYEEEPPYSIPDTFCPLNVISSTEVHYGLPSIIPSSTKPTDLKVSLIRNGTHSGTYKFQMDDDAQLALENGDDVGTIHYVDLDGNRLVNKCDELRFTDLYPDSNYEVFLFWAHTGDVITRVQFWTPH